MSKLDHEISLNSVLHNAGEIQDIYGRITNEFGVPTFQITRIQLSDGKTLFVEGEHDCPYIADYDQILSLSESKETKYKCSDCQDTGFLPPGGPSEMPCDCPSEHDE